MRGYQAKSAAAAAVDWDVRPQMWMGAQIDSSRQVNAVFLFRYLRRRRRRKESSGRGKREMNGQLTSCCRVSVLGPFVQCG